MTPERLNEVSLILRDNERYLTIDECLELIEAVRAKDAQLKEIEEYCRKGILKQGPLMFFQYVGSLAAGVIEWRDWK